MPQLYEKLSLFFDRLKNLSFWDRLLPWRWASFKNLSYDAHAEFVILMAALQDYKNEIDSGIMDSANLRQKNEQLTLSSAKLEIENQELGAKNREDRKAIEELQQLISTRNETIKQWDKNLADKSTEISRLQEKLEFLSKECSQLKQEIGGLKKSEDTLHKEYEQKAATLDRIQQQIEAERKREQDQRHQQQIDRITSLKTNWEKHQDNVKEKIKIICQKHIIEYIDRPPFKGSPDNTIKICDEYVIFDAKAPATEDNGNFCKYVQDQAEKAKKYIQQENVKRDIFLVVPSDTIETLDTFTFNMGEYTAYVVAIDALEPIILALKKIEGYEFLEQLTPEERENICRIIGKFAHLAKRRIQIDHFFMHQFLDVLSKCECDLPTDIFQKTVEFERAEKLNPPIEKRAKQILTKDLIAESGKMKSQAEAKGMVFPDTMADGITSLPLYEDGQQRMES